MPTRLRPTAPIAAEAVLVGDPGRALALAQALLSEPKMSNHARGLWGYSGKTLDGRELTVQSTGMGGPSAALVLGDLAELGVRRAVRVGTCVAIDPAPAPGDPLLVREAQAWGGGGGGAPIAPEERLTRALAERLGRAARSATVASLDFLHRGGRASAYEERVDAADMQTAALLLRGEELGVAVAAVLIVAESATGEGVGDEALLAAAELAGNAAVAALGDQD